jgi:HTH-type transcriptional regulator / antitoxin HigA
MSDTLAIKPIRSEADYERALEDIDALFDARPGTPEGDELDVLVTLVEAYEAEHHPIEAPDPVALIEFAMEQREATRADLEPIIGSRGRVSEVLTRKRPLTLALIRKLNEEWGLPADVLVQPYPLRKPAPRSRRRARPARKRAA